MERTLLFNPIRREFTLLCFLALPLIVCRTFFYMQRLNKVTTDNPSHFQGITRTGPEVIAKSSTQEENTPALAQVSIRV